MPAKVTFPGSAGSYVDTADTNLLDADTAHCHQAVGQAVIWNGIPSLGIGADLTPGFGDNHGSGTVTTGTTAGYGVIIGGASQAGAPVSASTEYSYTVDFAVSDASVLATEAFATYFAWYDAAGTFISYSAGVSTSLDTDWLTSTETVDSPVGAAFAGVRIVNFDTTSTPAGLKLYWDKTCIRAGSTTDWVPSLRIVGDLDLRAKGALTDWTPAASNWAIGALTGNNGYGLVPLSSGRFAAFFGTGSADRFAQSDVLTATDGTAYVLRAYYDISAGTCTFTQDGTGVGATSGLATAAGTYASGSDLNVGANQAGTEPLDGDIYYAEVRDGIDGPVVARFDAEDVWDAI